MIKNSFTIVAFFIPIAAWAQEADEPLAGGGWDTFATFYIIAGGFILTGIGWAISWGTGKLKGTRAKETAARFLGLFNAGLQGAHAKFKMELEAARNPNSPGGAAITQGELDSIRQHMWDYLKATHGNFATVFKVVGVFTGAKAEGAATAFINAKIDAGVAELERADKAASGPA